MSKIRPYLAAVVTVHAFGLSQALAATLQVPSQFPTIQSAVDAAVSGDEIVVAPGVYPAGFNFNGKRLTVRASAGLATTIIDVTATGGTAVLAQSGEAAGTRLQGFSIRGATSSAVVVTGGSSLEIALCRISDSTVSSAVADLNFALRGGAGIYAAQSSILVSDTVFENLTISRISGQQDVSGDGATCGGTTFPPALPTVAGGAIALVNDADATIINSAFRTCRAVHTYSFLTASVSASGGAIDASASSLQVSNCEFSGCEAAAARANCYANTPSTPSSYIGLGETVSEGGAVNLRDGSVALIQDSSFGGASPCRANTSGVRPRAGSGARFVTARGGAVSVSQGARLQSLRNSFVGNLVRGEMVTFWYGNTTNLGTCTIDLEGGALSVRGTVAAQALLSQGDTFDSSSTIGEAWGAPAPYSWLYVTANGRGGHVAIRPGPAQATVEDGLFRSVSGAPSIHLIGGTACAILASSVTMNGSANAILCDANATLISQCILRDSGAAPVRSINNQSGPSLVGNYICQNTPNSIDGPWQDGGGNTFVATCIDTDCNGNGIEDSFEVGSGSVPDCNANDVPDSCDIASKSSEDCDENEIPDECQYRATNVSSPSLSPVQSGTTLTHSFQGLASAGTDVAISVLANADLSSATESIEVKAGGTLLGTLFQTGGADCTPVTGELLVPKDTFNGLLTKGGTLSLQFVPSFAVTAGTCNPSSLVATVEYQPSVPGDCNGNSLPDICDILAGTEQDVNDDWIPDSCQDLPACPSDLNLDGQVGAQDIALLLGAWGTASSAADVNGDGSVNAQDLGVMLAAWGACP